MEVHSGKIHWPERDEFVSIFASGKFYTVPQFQRPYAWSSYQREELLTDVKRARARGENFVLPEMLIKRTGKTGEVVNYEIGDGQQRLTSIALLILAIWHHSRLAGGNLAAVIVPLSTDPLGTDGVLARKVELDNEPVLKPRILFQSDEPNAEFEKLLVESDVLALERLRNTAKVAERENSLIDAFFEFFDMLGNEETEDLNELFVAIREKVSFPIIEFDGSENMYRSFGRMNSLGIPLKNSELIKAAFYGAAEANQSRKLGEEIVKYWTDSYESAFWNNKKRNNLDDALLQSLMSIHRFPQVQAKDWLASNKNVQHWLFDQWGILLDGVKSTTELREIFEGLKRHLFWYSSILKHSELGQELKPGSLMWEAKVTLDYIGSGKSQSFAIILRVLENFKDDEADAINALQLIQKFGITFWLTVEKKDIQIALLRKDTVFSASKFTYDELRDYLLTGWPTRSDIASTIVGRNFTDGLFLKRAFTFGDNLIARKNKLESSALRSMSDEYDREHILPSSENAWGKLTETQSAIYRNEVNKIGNSIPFYKSTNRSVQDMPVAEKIAHFYSLQSPAQLNWLPDLKKVYNEAGDKWGPAEIKRRTVLLSNFFADELDPSKI